MDDKNPPAFPVYHSSLALKNEGMTLRDYFAAKVLQSLLTMPRKSLGFPEWLSLQANIAYQAADWMLAEREKSNAS